MARPRVYDRDEIAKKLLEWAQKDDSTNLNGFCCEIDIAPSELIAMSKDTPLLSQAYEKAKAFIANRREKLLSAGKLHVKAYDLNASVYDRFTKDEKRAQLEYEHSLKLKEQQEQAKTLADLAQAAHKGEMSQS